MYDLRIAVIARKYGRLLRAVCKLLVGPIETIYSTALLNLGSLDLYSSVVVSVAVSSSGAGVSSLLPAPSISSHS